MPNKFCLGSFEFIEEYLRVVIEESRSKGKLLSRFNEIFITLTPKIDNTLSFEQFKPVSLSNYIHKIISKIIAMSLETMLSSSISEEEFEFLEGRQFHEVVVVVQEGVHIIKVKHLKASMLKFDMSEAYAKVN
jgi:hypothetical protein